MPASLHLQEELGDDVQVIFVESQGASRDRAAAFALRQKWTGTNAMWTDERPADAPGNSLPAFVLIGIDGEVLLTGNPLAMKKQIEEAIAEELARAGTAPEGTPRELDKAWSEFGKGNLSKAIAEAEKVAQTGDVGLSEASQAAAETFRRRGTAKLDRVGKMMETGDYVRAGELLDQVARSVAGNQDLEARVAEVRQALEAEGLATEREAAGALFKIEEKLAGKGGPEKQTRDLEKLAEKYPGTKAAGLARRYLDLLAMEL